LRVTAPIWRVVVPHGSHILATELTRSHPALQLHPQRDLFGWCAEHQVRLIYARPRHLWRRRPGLRGSDDLESLTALRPLNGLRLAKWLSTCTPCAGRAGRRAAAVGGPELFNVYGPK